MADEWVELVLATVVWNTPELNPGGFAPDAALDAQIAESECAFRERGPYQDFAYGGSYVVLDRCGPRALSVYIVNAAPFDLSSVVNVIIAYQPADEATVIPLIMNSLFFDPGRL